MADPHRLRQVVGNLTANAVRYTHAGAVQLEARGHAGGVEITVSDTGIGIAASDLPHLFERFWRAEKSHSRRSGGSGLGLAITRHLVEEHGGRIEVRSSLGAGTTVTVRIPRP